MEGPVAMSEECDAPFLVDTVTGLRVLCLVCHPTVDPDPNGQSQPCSSHRKAPHAAPQTCRPPPPDCQSPALPAP